MSRPEVSLRLATALVAGSFFRENLDGTIITTAMPQMARTFHVRPPGLDPAILLDGVSHGEEEARTHPENP
ncbi:MAG: hypothetical protein H6Q00_73, partial [Holophagaceae bacterium]|nr:hypothetical protein [Holophagaceae bacterium]